MEYGGAANFLHPTATRVHLSLSLLIGFLHYSLTVLSILYIDQIAHKLAKLTAYT